MFQYVYTYIYKKKLLENKVFFVFKKSSTHHKCFLHLTREEGSYANGFVYHTLSCLQVSSDDSMLFDMNGFLLWIW